MSHLDSIKLADYTRSEDWLNSISHMVGGAFSIVVMILCFVRAYAARRWDYAVIGFVYAGTMLGMYSCSSVYHALKPNNGKRAMRTVDHSMIFPMIAGTITPYALLVVRPVNAVAGWVIFGIAWAVVAAAVPITLTLFNKTKVVQMVLYLALGWMIIFAIKTLWECFNHTGLWLLVAGGIAYTLGAIIYGIGSKKRYFHSVFHFFVLIGSILHFLSLYMFVFTV